MSEEHRTVDPSNGPADTVLDDTPTDPGITLGAGDVARLFDKLDNIEKTQRVMQADMASLRSSYQQQALSLANLEQRYAQTVNERSPSEELRAVGAKTD